MSIVIDRESVARTTALAIAVKENLAVIFTHILSPGSHGSVMLFILFVLLLLVPVAVQYEN